MRYRTNEVGATRRRDSRLLVALLVAVLAMVALLGGRAESKHGQATGAELTSPLGEFTAPPTVAPTE